MAKHVYMVMWNSGEYSDYQFGFVGVCSTKKKADQIVADRNAQRAELQLMAEQFRDRKREWDKANPGPQHSTGDQWRNYIRRSDRAGDKIRKELAEASEFNLHPDDVMAYSDGATFYCEKVEFI